MTRMTASEAFVETLVAQGVTDVFGIVGSAYMDALDIFPAAGIRFIPTVHEQGSAHMADGYSRAGNRHGARPSLTLSGPPSSKRSCVFEDRASLRDILNYDLSR